MKRAITNWLRAYGAHWHWANENEKPGGRYGSPWRHSRAWLHLGDLRPTIGVEWCHGDATTHATLRFDQDGRTVSIGLALPGFSYYLNVSRIPAALFERLPMRFMREDRRYPAPRSIGLRVFDSAIWWSIWEDDHEWRSSDPRWMSGSWRPLDTLLGKVEHSEVEIEKREVTIPMPEHGYPATVAMAIGRWARPRWPRWPFVNEITRAHVEIQGGIGKPGKGENSYDLGDDATYSVTASARSVEDAIGMVVAGVLRDRRNRGGSHEFVPSATPSSAARNPAHPVDA